jgi:hypothetical protein
MHSMTTGDLIHCVQVKVLLLESVFTLFKVHVCSACCDTFLSDLQR